MSSRRRDSQEVIRIRDQISDRRASCSRYSPFA